VQADAVLTELEDMLDAARSARGAHG
jgi:hypothetical protein